MSYPADYPGRSSILGTADLITAIPSWLTFTRGAGSWSNQTAVAADGTTFIETGTSQNTARHGYVSAAGRRMLHIEPTRTNVELDNVITEVNVTDQPDGWASVAGAAATDYDVVTGGPLGRKFRLLDTATANRGVADTATLDALTTYTWSAWTRRTGTAGAASLFAFATSPGNATITLDATLHDWQREQVTAATVGAANNVYMTANGDTPGVVELWGVQMEASTYASTMIPTTGGTATRAAELCAINAAKIGATAGYVSFLWSPMWASTNSTAVATLFTWGVGWRVDYDGADDKIKVVVNTTSRAESAALTFAAGDLIRVSVRYGAFGQHLTVNGTTTTNATAWGSPTIAAFLGSRAASANCESAAYGDLVLSA